MKHIAFYILLLSCCFSTSFAKLIKRNVDRQSYESAPKFSKTYAIVVDAGSSGSRMYAYWWRTDRKQAVPTVQHVPDPAGGIVTMKDSPGISSYGDNPNGAVESIKLLLKHAGKFIPISEFSKTHVLVLATVS